MAEKCTVNKCVCSLVLTLHLHHHVDRIRSLPSAFAQIFELHHLRVPCLWCGPPQNRAPVNDQREVIIFWCPAVALPAIAVVASPPQRSSSWRSQPCAMPWFWRVEEFWSCLLLCFFVAARRPAPSQSIEAGINMRVPQYLLICPRLRSCDAGCEA